MHATQQAYVTAKAAAKAAWAAFTTEEGTDSEWAAYDAANATAKAAETAMIDWAIGNVKKLANASEWSLIVDLEPRTRKNVAMRQKLAEICLKLVA